jgi:hypothetical protein
LWDLTRQRTDLVRERVRALNGLEKILEDAAIKTSLVLSKTLSMSSRAMIEALISGERDAIVLAALAIGKARARSPIFVRRWWATSTTTTLSSPVRPCVTAAGPPPWQETGPGRGHAQECDQHLAHAQQEHRLPRPRTEHRATSCAPAHAERPRPCRPPSSCTTSKPPATQDENGSVRMGRVAIQVDRDVSNVQVLGRSVVFAA